MGINVKDPSITKDAEELAAKYGVSVEEAIGLAVREKLQQNDNHNIDTAFYANKYKLRKETPEEREARHKRVRALVKAYRALPVYDHRSSDEILGYKEDGTLE